jgi:hypothetical protein
LSVPEFVTACNDDGPMVAICEYISRVRASETGFPPRQESAPTTIRYEQSQSPFEIGYFVADLSAINDDALFISATEIWFRRHAT